LNIGCCLRGDDDLRAIHGMADHLLIIIFYIS